MASERIKGVPDPIFNDFVYTVMYNMSAAQKRELSGRYQKAVMSEKAAKAFLKTASDDDKKIILAAAGMKFYWVFQSNDFKQENLRDILDAYEKNNKVSALNQIAHQGLFVTDDKAFTRLLGLMSASIHHPSFFFELSLLRTGWHTKKWAKRFFNENDLLTREADENVMELAKAMLQSSIALEYAKGSLGVSSSEMKILLYLYTNSHRHLSETHLTEYFTGYMRAADLRLSLRNLHKSGHAEIDRGLEKKYTITASGTRKVSDYLKLVFSKVNKV